MRHLIDIMMAAMLLAACSAGGEEVTPVVPDTTPAGSPMTFSIGLSETSVTHTRASLEQMSDNFAVMAWKHMPDATRQLVMARDEAGTDCYRVQWDAAGSQWYYEGITYSKAGHTEQQYLKYWDLSATQYTFAAYTPYDAANAPSIDSDGHITLTGITGHTPDTPPCAVARTIRTIDTPHDVDDMDAAHQFDGINSATSPVPLNFHLLMSRVTVKAYADNPITLGVVKVEICDGQTIRTMADYDETATPSFVVRGTPTDRYLCNETYIDGMPIGTDPATAVTLSSRVEIPQTWTASKLQVYVTCVTQDGSQTYTGTFTIDHDWAVGMHYIYKIKINNADGKHEVILFHVDMHTWKWKEGNSMEDTETNW